MNSNITDGHVVVMNKRNLKLEFAIVYQIGC